jgi:hypothetical protein
MIEPMVLRADPRRLLVSEVAEEVAKGCAELAKTFRGPGSPEQGRLVRVLQSRTVFALKLINRLYAHPPPDR